MTISQILIVLLLIVLGAFAILIKIQLEKLEIYEDWIEEEISDEED